MITLDTLRSDSVFLGEQRKVQVSLPQVGIRLKKILVSDYATHLLGIQIKFTLFKGNSKTMRS